MTTSSTAPVTYVGPADQNCYELAEATGGPATLEHGKTYVVPWELAKRLLHTSAHFVTEHAGLLAEIAEAVVDVVVDAPAKKPTKPQLLERAAELGLTLAKSSPIAAIASAIAEAEATLAADANTDTTTGDEGDEPDVDEEA